MCQFHVTLPLPTWIHVLLPGVRYSSNAAHQLVSKCFIAVTGTYPCGRLKYAFYEYWLKWIMENILFEALFVVCGASSNIMSVWGIPALSVRFYPYCVKSPMRMMMMMMTVNIIIINNDFSTMSHLRKWMKSCLLQETADIVIVENERMDVIN